MSILHPFRRADRVSDKAWFAFVHEFPCLCCWLIEWRNVHHSFRSDGIGIERLFVMHSRIDPPKQSSFTEAAHIGDSYTGVKCADRESIPLCKREHHQHGKFSHHELRKGFWEHWGIDREKLLTELAIAFEDEGRSGRGESVLDAREAVL